MPQVSRSKTTISQKCNWVPAKWVMEVTGWDKEKMRRAREQKVVITKMDNAGYLYDLNSIHESLLSKKEKAGSVTSR